MNGRIEMVRPPVFGNNTAADSRRWEFDFKNEILLTRGQRPDVVFIGDSITHIWEVNAYFHRFGLVVNRGIGGDTADIMAQRLMGDAIQLQPRACVMMIGINNLWCIDNDGANPDDVFTLLMDSYRKILTMAGENGLRLLVCSLMPLCDRSEMGQGRNRFVLRVNAALRALCEEAGVPYVDYHAAVTDTDGMTMREGLTEDGLHPHVYGYDIMAKVLTPYLERELNLKED